AAHLLRLDPHAKRKVCFLLLGDIFRRGDHYGSARQRLWAYLADCRDEFDLTRFELQGHLWWPLQDVDALKGAERRYALRGYPSQRAQPQRLLSPDAEHDRGGDLLLLLSIRR